MFLSKAVLRFLTLIFLCVQVNRSFGQWTDGQPAANVMGQPTFTTSNPIADASGLNRPNQVVIDPVSGKIFVADAFSNRVLRYPSIAAYTDGANAEAVFGQSSMTNASNLSPSATSLNGPSGIALDDNGNLWIADGGNNRVVRLSNAVNALTGSTFDMVLGQTGFTGSNPGTGLAGLSLPWSLIYKNNALWVSDYGNNRILKFENPSILSSGAPASMYLGTGIAGLADNALNGPGQIFVDIEGSLWVADANNNRVLKFSNANTLATSAPADLVIGQSGFLNSSVGLSKSALNFPWGVYVDEGGRLYIADSGNDRVLIYNKTSLTGNGPLADHVIGQIDFDSKTTTLTQDKVSSPLFLTVENDLLFVSDFSNNRVMIFKPSMPLPVNLLSFSAIREEGNNQTLLTWKTVNEQAFSGFEIEESFDKITFFPVEWISAKRESVNSYEFKLADEHGRLKYFRLKMVDENGSFSYSKTIAARESRELIAYPNPFSEILKVELPGMAGRIHLYNNLGKEVRNESVTNNEVILDLQYLPKGEYLIKILTNEDVLVKKVLKIN